MPHTSEKVKKYGLSKKKYIRSDKEKLGILTPGIFFFLQATKTKSPPMMIIHRKLKHKTLTEDQDRSRSFGQGQMT